MPKLQSRRATDAVSAVINRPIRCGALILLTAICGCEPGESVTPQQASFAALYRFTDEVPGEAKVRFGNQHRNVLSKPPEPNGTQYVPIATHSSLPVVIPAEGKLDFGIGVEPIAGVSLSVPVTFSVSIETDRESEEIYRTEIEPASFAEPRQAKWIDESVDLSRWAGAQARFTFSAESYGDEHPGARWAAPILYSTAPRAADGRSNLIIISLDTLRADRMSLYGYERNTTPHLDRFAEQCYVFEECIAPSSWTTPSHATIFTGLSPAVHGATGFSISRLRRAFTTSSELASQSGYLTVAFTEGGLVGGEYGFHQGFDLYSDGRMTLVPNLGAVEETVAAAEDWLERYHNQPFMMFFHTYEPHWPYVSPQPYNNEFTASPDALAKFLDERTDWTMKTPIDPDDQEVIKDLYDGCLAYTDRVIGGFLDRIRTMGLLENTAIIILSDHGEGLWDHGVMQHRIQLHHEMLHVPLIIHMPGSDLKNRRIGGLVALADMFPTALDLLDIDHAAPRNTHSLVPLMKGAYTSRRRQAATAHQYQPDRGVLQIAIQSAAGKYIVSANIDTPESPIYGYTPNPNLYTPAEMEEQLMSYILSGKSDWWSAGSDDALRHMFKAAREELYLRPGDARETTNRAAEDSETIRDLRQRLANRVQTWKAQGQNYTFQEVVQPLTQEELTEMEALGYL